MNARHLGPDREKKDRPRCNKIAFDGYNDLNSSRYCRLPSASKYMPMVSSETAATMSSFALCACSAYTMLPMSSVWDQGGSFQSRKHKAEWCEQDANLQWLIGNETLTISCLRVFRNRHQHAFTLRNPEQSCDICKTPLARERNLCVTESLHLYWPHLP